MNDHLSEPLPFARYDVIIVGAGPVGLFLASELRLSNLHVLILEQAESAYSPLKGLPFGIRGLSVPTIETFYRRGLLTDIATSMSADSTKSAPTTTHWMQQTRRPGGHFAGIQFFRDTIDASKWRYRLPSPADTGMATTMEHIETTLAKHADETGVNILRGFKVDSFKESDDGVFVHAGGQTFHGSWLVGCDGGRSIVRKEGHFDFVGTDPEFTGYSVEVELADPENLSVGRHYTATGMYTYQKPGTVAMVDFDGGAFHRTKPITAEHVQSVLRRISETDVTVTSLLLATTWTDRAHQAKTYRKGRVLLAGDAAHIHSPLGGQGLNLGLGDALNLGWKLASTIHGTAPAGLLDTYTSERHPVGAQILDWSRAQVALMRPTRSSRALESIIRDLMDTRDGATYFAERVWGLSLQYPLGDSHPLVGRSVPDFEFADGTRLGAHFRDGRGVLLDFNSDTLLQQLASNWASQITYVSGNPTDRLGLSAILIRPDGFVAWASDGSVDRYEVTQVMSRWFRTA